MPHVVTLKASDFKLGKPKTESKKTEHKKVEPTEDIYRLIDIERKHLAKKYGDFITAKQLKQIMPICEKGIYRFLNSGEIDVIEINNRKFVATIDLARYTVTKSNSH